CILYGTYSHMLKHMSISNIHPSIHPVYLIVAHVSPHYFKEPVMTIEPVPGTNLMYYLIAFDAEGRERNDDPNGLMSQRVLDVLANEPITDVFLFSHGWQGDIPAAREQYGKWITAMAQCTADVNR